MTVRIIEIDYTWDLVIGKVSCTNHCVNVGDQLERQDWARGYRIKNLGRIIGHRINYVPISIRYHSTLGCKLAQTFSIVDKISPGQVCALHASDSTAAPAQFLPPLIGGLQFLDRVRAPPPHVLLHDPYSAHGPHLPSTETRFYWWLKACIYYKE